MSTIRSLDRIQGFSEIGSIGGIDSTGPGVGGAGSVVGPSFESVLGEFVAQASEQERAAANQAELLARGASDDLHGTMIAVKEAEISLKLVGSVRNKLIDAFQEIWRTNV